jgi:hypothetical protein
MGHRIMLSSSSNDGLGESGFLSKGVISGRTEFDPVAARSRVRQFHEIYSRIAEGEQNPTGDGTNYAQAANLAPWFPLAYHEGKAHNSRRDVPTAATCPRRNIRCTPTTPAFSIATGSSIRC